MLCSKNQITRYCSVMQRRIHISPVLRQLHWLPVHHRIKFEMAILVYKSLHGLAPQYLVEDRERVAGSNRRQLRSSHIAAFVIPRTYTHLGDWAFPVAGPRLDHVPTTFHPTYDSLPLPFSTQQFCRELKMYLFGGLRLQHLATFCL